MKLAASAEIWGPWRLFMRRSVLSFVAAVGCGTFAQAAVAADLPVKAPVIKAVPTYDWTGFYLGVNAGVGVGRDFTRLDIPTGVSFETSNLNPQGGVFGGQIGYNWQVPNAPFGALVFGVEADIQGAGMSDNG